MKDLYRILGFDDCNASDAEIERRLRVANSSNLENKRARYILTDPARKEVYDRHYQTLKMIGRLRQDFRVDRSPSWNTPSYREFNPNTPTSDGRTAIYWFLGFAGIVFLLWALESTTKRHVTVPAPTMRSAIPDAVTQPARPSVYSPPSKTIDYNHQVAKPEKPVFEEPKKGLPNNGILTQGFLGSGMAPLKVVTPQNSIDNYYVKMVNVRSGNDALTFFVRSGQSVEVKMPLGTYEMRYATGKYWYGEEHLFGPATLYYRAEDRFHFRVNGTFVEGYTVELYKQVDGNLETEEIDPEEF